MEQTTGISGCNLGLPYCHYFFSCHSSQRKPSFSRCSKYYVETIRVISRRIK